MTRDHRVIIFFQLKINVLILTYIFPAYFESSMVKHPYFENFIGAYTIVRRLFLFIYFFFF